MALWTKAQQLPNDSIYFQQIKCIYGEHFPIEVRHYLAHFIEEKFWSDLMIHPDQPAYEQCVSNLIGQLIQELETKAETTNDAPEQFLVKLKLAEAAKMFRHRYSSNPMQLFNLIRHCLTTEMNLLQKTGAVLSQAIPSVTNGDVAIEIGHKLEIVRRRAQIAKENIRRFEQAQDDFAQQYHECTKINAHLQQLKGPAATDPSALQYLNRKDYLESELNGKLAGLVELRMNIMEEFAHSIRLIGQVQIQILEDELDKWKRAQQLAGNGYHFQNNLDQIQEWCESLVETIWINRQSLKELERIKQKLDLGSAPSFPDSFPTILAEMTELLTNMVTSTFVIEKQPPQVMKTNTRFTTCVRLLVGGKLHMHMSSPVIKVSILSESQSIALLKTDKPPKGGESAGEILNNSGAMEFQPASKQMTVGFRNMQLKRIKRAEKKGTESVMDEKFTLLFQSSFALGGGELMMQVWTLSLPVVVIVHGNQEPHAWATVTWDNAFSEQHRIPFQVPDKVPWLQVRETLSQKFKFSTGRGLTDDNMSFLADKLFRGNNVDTSNAVVTWAQFCKEPLPDRNFTFWEWFFAIMKLTKEHLRGPWEDGAIMGFIKKSRAEEMLARCPVGTFLLRFSDSELGGITIAWISDTREVFNLQPFTAKDFSVRSLADRIFDLADLITLFPDTVKDVYFGKYYTSYENPPGDYVRPVLVTHVMGKGFNTPQHSSFMNADPNRDTPSVASSYGGSVTTTVTGPGGPPLGAMEYLESLDESSLTSMDINISEIIGYH